MPDNDQTPRSEGPGARRPSTGDRPSGSHARDPDESVYGDSPTTPPRSPASARSGSSRDRPPADLRPEILALPNPGDRIDEFVLEESIGAGGMGAVFRAIDTNLDRQVAIKILPPDQAVDAEVVLRYRQEGRSAAQLDHDNIARVFRIGDDGRYHYIVFEYIEGTTLRQRLLRETTLPVDDAVDYTLQIARALVHAAARGVVHRDIKPSNIIITPTGRAKLVDMGLARRFERDVDNGLTQTGMTLGTFDYISPEQARDPRDVDIRGDLYSLGCTLFHMLAGRPPFPEGTVLQKLIQHREEAPPDIRAINPEVGPDLAEVVARLMAKDRDLRYQSPEELAADLWPLTPASIAREAAESMGIDPNLGPSGLATPAWARHVVWGGPGLVFLLILGGIAWWGDGPQPSTPVPPSSLELTPPGRESGRLGGPNRTSTFPGKASSMAIAPRELAVGPTDDLARVLADAPPRSTILLSEKGPYVLRGNRPIRLVDRDLTIQAEVGVRPVIRAARRGEVERQAGAEPSSIVAPMADSAGSPLIEIDGGRVTLDGIDFVEEGPDGFAGSASLDALGTDPTLDAAFGSGRPAASTGDFRRSALSISDAEVLVRRCSFFQLVNPGKASGGPIPSAIRLQASVRTSTSRGLTETSSMAAGPAALIVDSSEFDGNQVAILASGPTDLSLRDTSLGPVPAQLANVWCENPEAAAVPASIRFDRVNGMIGPGPLLRLQGTSARVVARQSVFAPVSVPPEGPPALLVVSDDPDRFDWRGVDNLYARIAVFFRSTGLKSLPAVRTFEAWADDPNTFREVGSAWLDVVPWERVVARQGVAPERPSSPRGYRLTLPRSIVGRPGVRSGPTGMQPNPTIASSAGPANRVVLAEVVIPPKSADAIPPDTSPSSEPIRPADLSRPVEVAPSLGASAGGSALTPMPLGGEPELSTSPSRSTAGQVPRPPAELGVIRNAAQFIDALDRDEPGTRTLVVAAGADLVLPSLRIRGSAHWTIRAERGAARPRIRFEPGPASRPTSGGWLAWLAIRSGGLRLEGVDLVIPPTSPGPGATSPRAAFVIRPGSADLVLNDCTVTVEEGPEGSPRSTVVAVLSADDAIPNGPFRDLFGSPGRPSASSETRIRVNDCLLRSGGGVVDVGGGRAVEIDIDNAVIATSDALLLARGKAGPPALALSPAHTTTNGSAPLVANLASTVRLAIHRVAGRVLGGLVHLESGRDRPSLPIVDVSATDSILATAGPDAPLVRVDGQGDLESLRDRLRWEARSVAYHKLNTYRIDRTTQPGVSPARFDPKSWEVSVGLHEQDAIRGDLGFSREWDADRPIEAVRPADLQLRPESPTADAAIGPDFLHIPNPPRP